MIYFAALAFLIGTLLGLLIGLAFENIKDSCSRHEAHLETTRKSLEKAFIESGLAEEIMDRKQQEEDK